MPTVPKDLRKSNKLRLIALIFFLYISFFTAITKIKTCFFLHLSFYKHNFNFETDIFILVNKHNSSIVVPPPPPLVSYFYPHIIDQEEPGV